MVQVVLSYIFFDRHTETILRLLSQTIGGDVALVAHMVEDGKPMSLVKSLATSHLNLGVNFERGSILKEKGQARDTWLYDHLHQGLKAQLTYPFFIRMSRETIFIEVELSKGILKLETPRKRLFSKTTNLVLLWTTASALLLFIVAILFMRNQIKPIRKLANAAERFGKGHEIVPFKPEGALEVRKAALAFNQMRHRILRFVEERTHQLAGVSHDLRTPLARMKLQLALMPDSIEKQSLQEDVEEMTYMIQGFLEFARGTMDEPSVELSLRDVLTEFVQYFSKQHPDFLTLGEVPHVILSIKKHILNRSLTNIVLNAHKHGSKAVMFSVASSTFVEIFVDDDGPGIPENKRAKVFQPFVRLDSSRNRETGGVGLGLAIVRDAIHLHGGRVELGTSPWGGLRVQIRLPR